MSDTFQLYGHAAFADFIASDDELSLYKSFNRLGARNILYLQSELLELEAQLNEFDEQDAIEGDYDVLLSTKCWETFAARAQEHSREKERMEVIRKIRDLTKEYYEALLLRNQVLRLQKPGNRVFEVFAGWFEQKRPFVGYGRDLLQVPSDFVTLKATEGQDRLSKLVQNLGGRYLHGVRGPHSNQIKYYSENVLQRFIVGAAVVLAASLLEGAIVSLYMVTNPNIQLGLIAVFTSLFAATLALLTNAKLAEMFAATAAYAAVLVVFISGNLGNPNRNG